MVLEENIGSVRLITLNHYSKYNILNEELKIAIKNALIAAEHDDTVKSLVVYGGANRSFSAGGNYNEIKKMSGEAAERWVDGLVELYRTVLEVNKPTVAAVDGYAIGIGFQFALMFDRRVMAADACFVMPELKQGVCCSLGAAILHFTHGYTTMQDIIYRCSVMDAGRCLEYRLINQITDRELLVSAAIGQANLLAAYQRAVFGHTKRAMNKPFIQALEQSRQESKSMQKSVVASQVNKQGAQPSSLKIT
ncbi:enoyl-CoA hydratase/isomerase family protein [Sodalis sp. dw_96]|uniref:enoyl-CoA hydratase/isomerase family protein n=1 Tax=Sodalis sp. dw_96 TaxID=2719794 RepID=UPI001BD39762|nr:enoyl-CoA hydratase/isomerase family protein [Sodalis sp. dw_96]